MEESRDREKLEEEKNEDDEDHDRAQRIWEELKNHLKIERPEEGNEVREQRERKEEGKHEEDEAEIFI